MKTQTPRPSKAQRVSNREVEDERQSTLIRFLTDMAETVHRQIDKSVEALLTRNEGLAGAVCLHEPRVNALEVVIDEHAVLTLTGRKLADTEVRLIVSSIKINNDLERMGDLAASIAQRVVSLALVEHPVELPQELIAMAAPVQEMVRKSLGALSTQDMLLAEEVLRSDHEVDQFRDRVYEKLLGSMSLQPREISSNFQLLLVSRYLERIADHCTNIAEDVIYWVRGIDVRHNSIRQAIKSDYDYED